MVATMRDPARGAALAALERVLVLPLDVRDGEAIKRAYADALARFGAIDVVVNNAGFDLFGPFEEATEASLRDQIETNLIGPILMIRGILPHFRARRAGMVINVTSLAAFSGPPFNSYYAATKWGIEGLTESLAAELATFGIHFKLVEPGLTATEIFSKIAQQEVERIADYDGFRERVAKALLPDGDGSRGSTPEAVAAVLLEAAGDPSQRLRYPAGAGAQAIAKMRDGMTSEQFVSAMRKFFPA